MFRIATMFLEMSRDETHGGAGWEFTKCVWAPTRKKNGHEWRYWSLVRDIRRGDMVLHLRGKNRKAAFVGYSLATSNGYQVSETPPQPGEWGFATSFYRADLGYYEPFAEPLGLRTILQQRRLSLEKYLEANKRLGSARLRLFYVKEGGRLQCLNGAYLSEVDSVLFDVMFGDALDLPIRAPGNMSSVATGSQTEIRPNKAWTVRVFSKDQRAVRQPLLLS